MMNNYLAALIPAIVGVLGALAAWLKASAAQKRANQAHRRLNRITGADVAVPPEPKP